MPVDGLVGAFWVAIFVGIGGVLLTSRLQGRSTADSTVAVPSPGDPRLTPSGPGSGARSRLGRPARLR